VNKNRKAIVLIAALLLPALVFLFLKYFGRNEFAVAPLYETELPEGANDCGVAEKLPYRLPEPVMEALHIPAGDSLAVVLFTKETPDEATQVKRVKEEVGLPLYWFTVIDTSTLDPEWRRCVFFLKDGQDVALIDTKHRLRGLYSITDREDADRLITELTIILKQY